MYYFIKLTEHASPSLHCCLCFILPCQWRAGCFPGAFRASPLYLGRSFWARSELQAGELRWEQESTTNPALDMIRLYKRQSSGLCLFLNTHRCNMDDSPAKSVPVLLEAKLGSKAFWWVTTLQQERTCHAVVETRSLEREVLSSVFLSVSPLRNSLFALKHRAETVIVLIRTSHSCQMREEFVTQVWLKCFHCSSPSGEMWVSVAFIPKASHGWGTW